MASCEKLAKKTALIICIVNKVRIAQLNARKK